MLEGGRRLRRGLEWRVRRAASRCTPCTKTLPLSRACAARTVRRKGGRGPRGARGALYGPRRAGLFSRRRSQGTMRPSRAGGRHFGLGREAHAADVGGTEQPFGRGPRRPGAWAICPALWVDCRGRYRIGGAIFKVASGETGLRNAAEAFEGSFLVKVRAFVDVKVGGVW
jgi:hypothetical protein